MIKRRSLAAAYLWWFFLGVLGAHRYYCLQPIEGLFYTFTAGLFLIGWLTDVFVLPFYVQQANQLIDAVNRNEEELQRAYGDQNILRNVSGEPLRLVTIKQVMPVVDGPHGQQGLENELGVAEAGAEAEADVAGLEGVDTSTGIV